MKKILFALLVFISINGFAQVVFEKGYYIDNSGQKIECLIKNLDWRNNPINFQYKITENEQANEATIENVKEFGIYNTSKFIRGTVELDRSTEDTNNLSKDRNPIFEEEQLFLKVLKEGKANLYAYNDTGLRRYFYRIENSGITQLVYKKYETLNGKLGVNNYYKQQLLKELKCSSISLKEIENIAYKKNSLIELFTDYNTCNGSEINGFKEKKINRDLFNLTLRPRLNNSTLAFETTFNSSFSVDFGNKVGFGFGLEAEFVLPFNKNKLAIIIEPTYQSYKSDVIRTEANNISGGFVIAEATYSSIEVPIGFRHYFFINNKSKVFVNASFVLDIPLKTLTEYKRDNNSILFTFDRPESQTNLAFGAGYKFNDKFGLEIRYQTSREVIDANRSNQNSDYKTLSVIFGYSIF